MRLAVFTTHPIQYQVPIWRHLARVPGLETVVFYFSDLSLRGAVDPGFGRPVQWDIPLLDGYEYRFLSRDATLDRPASFRLSNPVQLLREERFDAVFVTGYNLPFMRQALRAAWRLGLKTVMRGEFTDTNPARGRLKSIVRDLFLSRFYKRVSAFAYIGVAARRHLLRLGVPEQRLYFSPYCIDSNLLEGQRKSSLRDSTRSRLGLKDTEFVFLYSGKLIPRKAPLLLIDALRLAASDRQIALIMLGDGPLRQEVSVAGKAVLGDRFLFQGFVNQSELGQYFAAADAFVIPSVHEPWGLVANEAMVFGLPVIASGGVCSHEDLVQPGETGWVFPAEDTEGLAAILRKVAEDRENARRMGEAARARVALYTPAAAADGIVRALGMTTP